MRTIAVKVLVAVLATIVSLTSHAEGETGKVYSVGVLLYGGPYHEAIRGLRDGLRELGFEEGKRYVLDIRDGKGDPKAVEQAAKELVKGKVDLIYALAGSVAKIAKQATENTDVPVVFFAGSDPVSHLGLVQSFARPGGNLTGVHLMFTDLTPKRLEILRELLPKTRRVLTFYNSGNKGAVEAASLAREAAQQVGIQLIERHVASADELRRGLEALKPGEADAYFFTSDAMVGSQAYLIIDRARVLKLPTVFHDSGLVAYGALASYGGSFYDVGLLASKYVHRVLLGERPQDLPILRVRKLEAAVNLKTARELGISISKDFLSRADVVYR